MTAGQISLILGSIAVAAALYLWAPILPDKKEDISEPVAANVDTTVFDVEAYTKSALENLDAGVAVEYEDLKAGAENSEGEARVENLKKSAEVLRQNNLHLLAALEEKKIAQLTGTDSAWMNAGKSFSNAIFDADSAAVSQFAAAQAAESFEKVLEINPENTDAKINLALVYMEGSQDVMKGVMLLREVTDTDPGNITANLILGRYGIVSGQFDKAISRLENVLSADSLNAEAYLYLAEAYEAMGDKTKAVAMLEQCRRLVDNPAFADVISQYIEKLKNS